MYATPSKFNPTIALQVCFLLHLFYFLIDLQTPNKYYKIQLFPQILLNIIITA